MSKPKIIVLYGLGSTGKTTTLNKLIQKMLPQSKFLYGKISNDPSNNSWAVFDYSGKTVAVITEGDNGTALDWYFDRINTPCNVIVCASRTKGSSVETIKKRFPKSYMIWETKWTVNQENGQSSIIDTLQIEANEIQAEKLLVTINSL